MDHEDLNAAALEQEMIGGDSLEGDSQDDQSETEVDSASEPEGSETDENSQQATPKMIAADRFNKLQSFYQKQLAENRKLQAERTALMGQSSYYQQLEKELEEIKQLQQSRQQQTPEDLSQMTPEEFMQRTAKMAREEARAEMIAEREALKQQEEQQARQETENQRNEKFQTRMDKVLAMDPDLDREAFKKFMLDNEIYNPLTAHRELYRDFQEKQATIKIQKETSQKIASNAKNNIASRGKSGVVPKKDEAHSSEADRVAAFQNMIVHGL